MQHENATRNTKHHKIRKEFTMTIKEMKDFFVQERLGNYYQMHDKQCKTDYLLDFGIILQQVSGLLCRTNRPGKRRNLYLWYL